MNSAGGWNVLTPVYACWRALEHCSCLLSLLLCQQCSFYTGLLLFKWTLGRLGERFRLSTLSTISLFSFWTVNSWVKCIPTTAGETGHCLQCLLSCRIKKTGNNWSSFPFQFWMFVCGTSSCMSCVLLGVFIGFIFSPTLFFVSVVFWYFFLLVKWLLFWNKNSSVPL